MPPEPPCSDSSLGRSGERDQAVGEHHTRRDDPEQEPGQRLAQPRPAAPHREPELREPGVHRGDGEAHSVDAGDGSDLHQWVDAHLRVPDQAPGISDQEGRAGEEATAAELDHHPRARRQQRKGFAEAARESRVGGTEHHVVGARHGGGDEEEEPHSHQVGLIEVDRDRAHEPGPGRVGREETPEQGEPERAPRPDPAQRHQEGNQRDPGEGPDLEGGKLAAKSSATPRSRGSVAPPEPAGADGAVGAGLNGGPLPAPRAAPDPR